MSEMSPEHRPGNNELSEIVYGLPGDKRANEENPYITEFNNRRAKLEEALQTGNTDAITVQEFALSALMDMEPRLRQQFHSED